ncbi:hypothetical protein N665_0187s0016 [Sinapis alba]|nr:hypothetical protein N665_0187s0016 [Sinapis alba]
MANNLQLSFLNQIKPHKTAWRIQVKIIHTWRHFVKDGTKIHASCKKTYVVTGAGGSYRSTGHKYRIAFVHNTKITISSHRDDNMFLNLVDFQTIKSSLLDSNFLIDVIGKILDLSDLETLQCTDGKQRKKLEFTLMDNCKETDGMVICLLRFAKIGQYRGEVQISNAYDANNDDSQALTIAESEENKLEMQIKRDKWMHYPQTNIRDLFEPSEEKMCRVVATVYAIDTDWGWYYFGCLGCNKNVFPHSKTVKKINWKDIVTHIWWCEICKSKVTTVSPRFKIHLLVKDDTGESSFMLLDSIAIGVVHESATNLLNGSSDELEETYSFPTAITALVGQTFMFGVYTKKDNSSSFGGCYKVGKVWKDLRMLMISDISESTSSPIQASEEPILLEAEGDYIFSTPSSKRKEDNKEAPELTSTSKKQCIKTIKMENIGKYNS